uniref:fructose-bisphosphatase n=1 Tax=Odontella aurita TaxID=265563 RepID=A0A7S4JMN6_9STRA|mmetsp:Transcript_49450/g.149017  ORF Transcript_49450/g.149017 Transcript_49450/m.149017 type:complete len:419 (+) Transcript_49450:98-1354(+)|eukprot:CAMPEP_0113536224 /NCGR_PEP_ID=MMETSP0015_2-20120614/6137_1 /TAXON_ID=2838 /ORGANISM="Odontella" /LENGTH=418 /DNA_ID=CAMNT_0000435555 /DNA_START=71 /DNA_END=1327 /DNA_ORIENTATION=- /assembly_acc=CAM_ASM_000160
MRISAATQIFLVGSAGAFVPARPIFPRCSAVFSVAEDVSVTNSPVTTSPVFDEVCDTTGVTLTRFMAEVAKLNPELSELTTLFGAIDTACKAITNMVKRSQLPSSETLGYEGKVNVQGEDQKKLDVITNDVLKRALRFTGKLGVLASEEEDEPVDLIGITQETPKEVFFEEGSKYVAVFDPLDGSSNVDAGIPTGTIIGIYKHDESCSIDLGDDASEEDMLEQEAVCFANTLQPGTNLVAAAYCLYSSSTFLVLTLGNGVYMFTLDEGIGEFVLSKPHVRIPESSSVMSFNEANLERWDKPMQDIVKGWRKGKGKSGKRFSSRYIGSMVGDVHRTLLYGGVFGYPGDTKNPNGKLRLLYEGAPMSFIMEQAGGLSTTGKQRVMEIVPEIVHQRVPVIMGSKNDVQELIDAYEAAGADQ